MTDYKPHLVTYCDILGFRQILNHLSADEVSSLLELFDRTSRPGQSEALSLEIYYAAFSDLIVRATNITSEENQRYPTGVLWNEIVSLLHVQAELIMRDVIVRGAISFGELVAVKHKLYGPSLVRAYELEAHTAVYPRIIIDPIVLHEFEKNPLLRSRDNSLPEDRQSIQEYLLQDSDGIYFINYLEGMQGELEDSETYLDFLSSHRDLIVKGLATHKDLSPISAKYNWLAKYHNKCVNGLSSTQLSLFGVSLDDLLIPPGKNPLAYNFE